jgi:translation initiation factor 2 gamma subunit (eIF-2gamma)
MISTPKELPVWAVEIKSISVVLGTLSGSVVGVAVINFEVRVGDNSGIGLLQPGMEIDNPKTTRMKSLLALINKLPHLSALFI